MSVCRRAQQADADAETRAMTTNINLDGERGRGRGQGGGGKVRGSRERGVNFLLIAVETFFARPASSMGRQSAVQTTGKIRIKWGKCTGTWSNIRLPLYGGGDAARYAEIEITPLRPHTPETTTGACDNVGETLSRMSLWPPCGLHGRAVPNTVTVSVTECRIRVPPMLDKEVVKRAPHPLPHLRRMQPHTLKKQETLCFLAALYVLLCSSFSDDDVDSEDEEGAAAAALSAIS